MKQILVYRFGLLKPTENADRVRAELLGAHRYRNQLTAIERARRAALREATMAHDTTLCELSQKAATAEAELATALGTITKARAKTKSKSETREMREAIRTARAKKSEALRGFREHKSKMAPELVAIRDVIRQRAGELVRAARALRQCAWGTGGLVEAAAQDSAEMPLYDGTEPNDPSFVRFDGTGNIGVQFIEGVSIADVFGSNKQLRIEAPDELDFLSPVRGERRRLSRTVVRMRIGSGADGGSRLSPIWGVWPMIMHRPIPTDGVIKAATVMVRRRGPTEEWSLHVTVDVGAVRRPPSQVDGAVAIDVGWRQFDDGVRVAVWRGTDGRTGELRLPTSMLERLRKHEGLASTREQNFNLARLKLTQWMAVQTGLPEWFSKATETLTQWRSIARLSALCRRWRNDRFTGDEAGYEALETWRYHDFHLWQWEENVRKKSLRHRKEVYRLFAAELSGQYRDLILEAFDLRKVLQKKPPEVLEAANEVAAHNRYMVAISELRLCLTQAFARAGTTHYQNPYRTTKDCAACHHPNEFDASAMVHFLCEQCGAVLDQDDNAAANLLNRWANATVPASTPARTNEEAAKSVEKESKWTRAARLRKEREARQTTARKVAANQLEKEVVQG